MASFRGYFCKAYRGFLFELTDENILSTLENTFDVLFDVLLEGTLLNQFKFLITQTAYRRKLNRRKSNFSKLNCPADSMCLQDKGCYQGTICKGVKNNTDKNNFGLTYRMIPSH